MNPVNRRRFMQSTAGGLLSTSFLTAGNATMNMKSSAPQSAEGAYDPARDMPLGVIAPVRDSADEAIAHVRNLGFSTCQLNVQDYSSEAADAVKTALAKYDILPTTLITMGPGLYVWNFYEGPITIGLVPRARRAERLERLRQGTDFCVRAGIPAVHAHFGFIPEDPNDILYHEFIETMKGVAHYARERGIDIYFETGQETPVALMRAILDIGYPNLGINYDTANLIMYGKANPVDAMNLVGPFIRALHAKDGMYPVNPRELGAEVPIGEGMVDFPKVIKKLKELRFKGHITIEREISGPKQIEDVKKAKQFLENIIRTV